MTTCAPSNQSSESYVFERLGRFSEQRVRCIFKFNVLAARPKAFPLQPHPSASLSDTTETGLLEALDPHPFRALLPGLRWSLGQWAEAPGVALSGFTSCFTTGSRFPTRSGLPLGQSLSGTDSILDHAQCH